MASLPVGTRGAERIFGYSAEEMIGKPISILAADDRVDEMPKILDEIKMRQACRALRDRPSYEG